MYRADSTELQQDERLVRRNCHVSKGMEAELRTNNKNSEVLEGTFASRMDIHQARTEAMQEKMDVDLKKVKATKEHLKV
jgi:hypothetical protein